MHVALSPPPLLAFRIARVFKTTVEEVFRHAP
jgi:DNA-binding XRE family transcriptional regulator